MRAHIPAFAVLALFVFLALTSAAATPLYEASDEAAHFLYAHNLAETGTLPVIPARDDLDVAAERGDVVAQWSIESHQPPLYYAIGALMISPTRRDDIENTLRSNDLIFTWGRRQGNHNQWLHSPGPPAGDTHVAVWIMRLYSLALACGTLWCIYRVGYLFTGSTPFALTAMLTTAVIPTFAGISASVNNDNLVTFLSAAAVYWTLWVMRFGLRKYDWAVIALVISAIALTKITGLAVVAVVMLGPFFAVRSGKVTRRQAVLVLFAIAAVTALNAGWWYVRNWQLYGDPLALTATQALWGRDFAVAAESGDVLSEISRVWRSFWLMIGHLHQPVWGPDWFYVAVLAVCVMSVVGWAIKRAVREPPLQGKHHLIGSLRDAPAFLILALAAVLPMFTLIYGTRTVDISYGRLLFPGLVGMIPLLVYGWWRLAGRGALIFAAPLLVMTTLMPYTVIRPAYPPLEIVDALPKTAIPLNVRVESSDLTLLAYEPLPRAVHQGDAPPLTLYWTGTDARNPALTAAWLPAVGEVNQGQITAYPGMAAPDMLSPGTIYRTRFPLPSLTSNCPPSTCSLAGMLRLQLKWQTDGLTTLNTVDLAGQPVSLLLDGPVYLDALRPPTDDAALASFSSIVELTRYQSRTLDSRTFALDLHWRILHTPPLDLTLTVQIFNDSGDFVTSFDGEIAGYPSRVWIENTTLSEERVIELLTDAPPGAYTIAVGWYTRGDLQRLPVSAPNVRDNLAVIGTVEVIMVSP